MQNQNKNKHGLNENEVTFVRIFLQRVESRQHNVNITFRPPPPMRGGSMYFLIMYYENHILKVSDFCLIISFMQKARNWWFWKTFVPIWRFLTCKMAIWKIFFVLHLGVFENFYLFLGTLSRELILWSIFLLISHFSSDFKIKNF